MKQQYDKYIVAFSGGKDSIACVLHLLYGLHVPADKIELWHHEVDGREATFMDWECTPAYCQAFADHFKLPLYFSWKKGGFKGEMLRKDQLTQPTLFENENHEIIQVGGTRGKLSTRLKFPQVSPDLKVRWCSAYLKIDIGTTAIINQKRFEGLKVVVVSGERAEESAARAKYKKLEPDRADNRDGERNIRYVDRMRPIKGWTEKRVWGIIKKHKVRVHPCYYMGWNRCSCKFCIFGNANQMASATKVSPAQAEEIMMYEDLFGHTIKRDKSLRQVISEGTPYEAITEELMRIATSTEYSLGIEMEQWYLPAGAYGESCGPM